MDNRTVLIAAILPLLPAYDRDGSWVPMSDRLEEAAEDADEFLSKSNTQKKVLDDPPVYLLQ